MRKCNFQGKGHARACPMTLYRELCKHCWTDRHAAWVVDSGVPKEACVTWGHIRATWRIRLNRPCAAAVRAYVKLLWPLASLPADRRVRVRRPRCLGTAGTRARAGGGARPTLARSQAVRFNTRPTAWPAVDRQTEYMHLVQFTQCSRKKQPLCFLVITSANINRFSQFFHRQIPKKTDWVDVMAISTSP